MPLYKNIQNVSISINNSFSIRDSGSTFLIEGGYLFSNSGFQDESYSRRNTGYQFPEISQDKFFEIKIDAPSLYATGIVFLNGPQKIQESLASTDGHSFFLNGEPDSDLFVFANSGESNKFYSNLVFKNAGEAYLSVGSGNLNNQSYAEGRTRKIIFNKNEGQKILMASVEKSGGDFAITDFEVKEDSYSFAANQSSFSRGLDGNWDGGDFQAKTPICLVDLENACVIQLASNNKTVSLNLNYGVNGEGYPTE